MYSNTPLAPLKRGINYIFLNKKLCELCGEKTNAARSVPTYINHHKSNIIHHKS